MQDFAADAGGGVEVDDAVGPRKSAVVGADRRAGRVLALVAAQDRRSFASCRGKDPVSMCFTQVRKTPSGTSFSDLQATVQAWQPMQRVWSSTKP